MTGRTGQRNAASKLGTTARPPWADWSERALHARAIRFLETYCIPRKGVGRGAPLKVAPWQAEWLEEILAPGVDAAGMTLPRGNGKSTFAGAVAVWALFDGAVAEQFGGQPQIPVVATTIKQAKKSIYGASLGFVKGHPELANRALTYSAAGDERIVVPGNEDGELFIVADDHDALQGLDPMLALVDEFGFISVEAWDALLLAGGKRERSLILGLGTRSPGNTPNALDHLLGQLELHGSITGFHLTDYHADAGCDLDDREQWRKANPALVAGYMRESAIESALKLSPESGFRVFKLNLKVDSQAGWLGVDGSSTWHKLRSPYHWRKGMPVWAGVDVSLHHDSTSVAWCQYRRDGRVHVGSRIWTPGPNKPIPFDEVEQCLRELDADFDLQSVAYDPRYFAASAQRLEAEGLLMVETPQSHARMVPLVGETYRKIVAGSLSHDAEPEFTSHVLNAVPFFADGTGFTLSKKKSSMHIDACIAMCLAVGDSVLTHAEPEKPAAKPAKAYSF